MHLVVHVRRTADAHQTANLSQTAHLSHQSAEGIVVSHKHLGLLRVFRRCDHEIGHSQHDHGENGDHEPSLLGVTLFEEFAQSHLIVIHPDIIL